MFNDLVVNGLSDLKKLVLQVLVITLLQGRIDAIGESNDCSTIKTLLAEQTIEHGIHAWLEVGVDSL